MIEHFPQFLILYYEIVSHVQYSCNSAILPKLRQIQKLKLHDKTNLTGLTQMSNVIKILSIYHIKN